MRFYIYLFFCTLFLSVINSQMLDANITLDKKKLIILTSENDSNEIEEKIYQIASSSAVQLKRYEVIDRMFLQSILDEQKLQHSGIVEQDYAVEIGKIASANEALLINMRLFAQKGIPPKREEKDRNEESNGLLGWVIKEVVKSEIAKATANLEKYPNNIQTIVEFNVVLINVENGKSIDSFDVTAEHVGGNKAKSLSKVLQQVKSQMVNKLKEIYKLSSEVLEVDGSELTLLLGKNMGISSKSIFEIISRDERKIIKDRTITIPGKSLAIVKINQVSNDASIANILREWGEIKPGCQAHEITGNIFSGGIAGIYGDTPNHMRLRFFAQANPFGTFGGDIHGDIGLTKDTRGRDDFQFGFGGSFILRLFNADAFTLGPTLNIPIDFHTRMDDEDSEGRSHWVFLPRVSPRIGIQSEIMVSSKRDIIIRLEYVLSNSGSKYWTYSEKQKNDENEIESETWNAHWDQNLGIAPDIIYDGLIFTLGFRKISFPSFSFN